VLASFARSQRAASTVDTGSCASACEVLTGLRAVRPGSNLRAYARSFLTARATALVLAAVACLLLGILAPSARAGTLVAIGSAQLDCADGFGIPDTEVPAVASSYGDTVYSATSDGASASLTVNSDTSDNEAQISSGDQLWGDGNAVKAGSSPSVQADCSSASGTISITLYALPSAPVSFDGPLLAADSPEQFPFSSPVADRYVASVQLGQGALMIGSNFATPQTIDSSGTVSLGSLKSGHNFVQVQALPGPQAIFTLSIAPLPITISGLAFSVPATRPGIARTARFSVSGSTTVDASILDASGQLIRELGTFAVGAPRQNAEATWDGRTSDGNIAPDDVYTLRLVSTDAFGDQTSATTTIQIDDTPPTVSPPATRVVGTDTALVVKIADAGSGLAKASISVDGTRRGTTTSPGTLFADPPPKAGASEPTSTA
jgi:FlgD Ig-like domain